MTFFKFKSFRELLNDWISTKKRGELSNLAKSIGVSTSLVSQVIAGKRTLSLEQVFELLDYIGANEEEKDYILALFFEEKVSSPLSKKYFKRKSNLLLKESKRISKRFKETKDRKRLTGVIKEEFYSSWKYTAIRQACSLEQVNTPHDVAKELGLPIWEVSQILTFLLKNELVSSSDGKLFYGKIHTHIPASDPSVRSHHLNWRMKAIDDCYPEKDDRLHFTAPMSITTEASEEIQNLLIELLEEVKKQASTPQKQPEELICLNVDFFKF